MRKLTLALTVVLLTAGTVAAEITNWWGLVSFRERYEVDERHYADPNNANFGKVQQTESNSKVRLGYQFGFKTKLTDHVSAGLTLRSGLGKVMWQDIDNENSSLNPGVQEAYIDWRPPFAQFQLGRVPQEGSALWDLYTSHNNLRDPIRQENPTDGVFSDKIGYLNGGKIYVPVGPVALRGTFHTDFTSGKRVEYDNSTKTPTYDNGVDQYVWLAGIDVDLLAIADAYMDIPSEEMVFDLEADFGLPSRIGSIYRSVDSDSVYADEDLWGMTVNAGMEYAKLTLGYAYNWRDSTYTSRFYDYKFALNPSGLPGVNSLPDEINEFFDWTLTTRYQLGVNEHEFGIYKGRTADYSAFHVYLDREFWDLNIQPRYIVFETVIKDDVLEVTTRKIKRYEVTATVRF
ncbi:hypothetical protein ACFLQV_04195 [Calditrichota bacterium]